MKRMIEDGTITSDKDAVDVFVSDFTIEVYHSVEVSTMLQACFGGELSDSIDLLDFGEGRMYLARAQNLTFSIQPTIVDSVDARRPEELSAAAARAFFEGFLDVHEGPDRIDLFSAVIVEDVRGRMSGRSGFGHTVIEGGRITDAENADLGPSEGEMTDTDASAGVLMSELSDIDDTAVDARLDQIEKALADLRETLDE